jgi:hypothetical protein
MSTSLNGLSLLAFHLTKLIQSPLKCGDAGGLMTLEAYANLSSANWIGSFFGSVDRRITFSIQTGNGIQRKIAIIKSMAPRIHQETPMSQVNGTQSIRIFSLRLILFNKRTSCFFILCTSSTIFCSTNSLWLCKIY